MLFSLPLLCLSLVSCTKRAFEDISSAIVFKNYSELPSKQAVLAELEEQVRPLFPDGLPNVDNVRGERIWEMRELLKRPDWNPILARWIWLKGLDLLGGTTGFMNLETEMDFFVRSLEMGSVNLLKDMVDYSSYLTPRMHFMIQVFLARFGLRPFYPHYPTDLLLAVDKWDLSETEPYSGDYETWLDFLKIIPLLSDYPVDHPHNTNDPTCPSGSHPISVAICLHSHFITRPYALPLDKLRCWGSIHLPESMRILAGVVKTYELSAKEVEKLLQGDLKALWPSFIDPRVPPIPEVIRQLLASHEEKLNKKLDGNISRFAISPLPELAIEIVHWLLNAHRSWLLKHEHLISFPLLAQTATVYPQDVKLIPWPQPMPPVKNLIPYTRHFGIYNTKLAPYFAELIKHYQRVNLEQALVGHINQRVLVSILRLLDPTYCKGSVAEARAVMAFWIDGTVREEWLYYFLSHNDPVRWVDSLKKLLSGVSKQPFQAAQAPRANEETS